MRSRRSFKAKKHQIMIYNFELHCALLQNSCNNNPLYSGCFTSSLLQVMAKQVGFDQLTTPSKVALFKLCVGNLVFVVSSYNTIMILFVENLDIGYWTGCYRIWLILCEPEQCFGIFGYVH